LLPIFLSKKIRARDGRPRKNAEERSRRYQRSRFFGTRGVLIIRVREGSSAPMTKPLLLTVCALLIAFGIFTTAVSAGFFVQLLGATVMAVGGSAAYLVWWPA
jgi:hypothetical protein